MKNLRAFWFAPALALAIALPAFAQEHKKDEHKAEPAKPAAAAPTPAPAPAKEAPKDAPKAAAAPAAAPAAAATMAAIGKPAPAFKLKDVNGKDVSLSDFAGKVVVLEAANAGCPVCKRHAAAKTAEKTLAGFKDKGVVWINIDSTATAKADDCKKFATDNKLGIYLMDPTGATGKAYGMKTTPHCFVIDAKGNLAYMGAIDDDNDGSKGEKAVNYVKEAIDAVLKGSTVAKATTEPYGCNVKYGS